MEYKTGNVEHVLSICHEASAMPDALGQNPLFFAVQRASDSEARQIAERLIAVVDPSRKDFGGQSPLFYAAAAGNLETVRLLLDSGCDKEEADTLNQTPLFYASRDGRIEVVSLLIQRGANASHIDRNGQTPLFYAARENQRAIIDLLIANKASVEHVDVAGRKPSYFAKLGGHVALAEYLESGPLAPSEDGSGRKRCRLVFVAPDGSHLNPTADQLEWMENKFPDICVWTKSGPISTGIVASPVSPPPVPSRSGGSFPKKKEKAPVAVPAPRPVWVTVARQIVSELVKKEDAWIFLRPVDPVRDMCPDYLSVIKQPIDLGSIRRKLGKYELKSEFVSDMELMFSNCTTYNKPGTLPEVLCRRVETLWRDLLDRNSFLQLPDAAPSNSTRPTNPSA